MIARLRWFLYIARLRREWAVPVHTTQAFGVTNVDVNTTTDSDNQIIHGRWDS